VKILQPPPRALPAATLLVALAAMASPAAAEPATEAARAAIGHERSALGAAAARVPALTEAARPPARGEETVTVASRSIDGGTAAEIAKAAKRPDQPAKLDLRTLDALPAVSGDAELQCLAEAIYFESRGEPLEGQVAVAEVVLNRVDDRRFPKTVCGVTNPGVGSGRGCQFSYACDGNSDVMKSAVARQRAEKLASLMLADRPRTVTDGATYFHTRSVRPSWSRKFARTTSIGHHIFYRPATQVAGG
jgi:spore germination cell wall hydrolase CwlJ-like protein